MSLISFDQLRLHYSAESQTDYHYSKALIMHSNKYPHNMALLVYTDDNNLISRTRISCKKMD